MLVKDIKPVKKVGKNILQSDNFEEIIEKIIEEPLQNTCKELKNKNIETVMSSANRNNITSSRINKKDVVHNIERGKAQTFEMAGKGFAWIMINYNTLSDENRKILFSLENELGEETIWFVQSSYIDFVNKIRSIFKLKKKIIIFDDKYANIFKQKQIKLIYNNKYPNRVVFIRMPIDENTKVEDVELYFKKIINKLVKQ